MARPGHLPAPCGPLARAWCAAVLCAGLALLPAAAPAAETVAGVRCEAGYVLPAQAPLERSLGARDPVLARHLRSEPWAELAAGHGARARCPDVDGRIEDPALAQGGHVLLRLHSLRAGVMLLHARGAAWLEWNGQPRPGDLYASGRWRTPVWVNAGTNELLLRASRAAVVLRLEPAPTQAFIEGLEATVPDLVEGRPPGTPYALGLTVVNPTADWTAPMALHVRFEQGPVQVTTLPRLPPLSVHRVAATFASPALPPGHHFHAASAHAELRTVPGDGAAGELLSVQRLALRIVSAGAARRVTFVSGIDGSVQSYGLLPARARQAGESPQAPGLLVALHGAGVDPMGFLSAFKPRAWAHVVTPAGRHEFGFHWEEWGRRDLLEVLAHAEATLKPDPRRRWLMGHSMGGHGTWLNGALLADRFAAIAPVAGWSTIWSYADAPAPDLRDPVQALLRRAASSSDTPALLGNLRPLGVYAKHPALDTVVPPQETMALSAALAPWHRSLVTELRPGIDHWPGGHVVEWPPLMNFLQARSLRGTAAPQIDFVTFDPAVASRSGWAEIHGQQRPLLRSRVVLDWQPARAEVSGTTENVRWLRLNIQQLGAPLAQVRLDGQVLAAAPGRVPPEHGLWLERTAGGEWQPRAQGPGPDEKQVQRGGRLPTALDHRPLLVVGTATDAPERTRLLDHARYLAETFALRGGFALEVTTDEALLAAPLPARNLVLIGHAGNHKAWRLLLGEGELDAQAGAVTVAGCTLAGDDLVLAVLRPRRDQAQLSVLGLAGTGPAGQRLAARLPLHVPGLGLADWLVLRTAVLERGFSGIEATGFFDAHWRFAPAESAWRSGTSCPQGAASGAASGSLANASQRSDDLSPPPERTP